MPSSLTKVLPRVLGFSPCLPVSVLVRVSSHSIVPFLGSLESVASLLVFRSPSYLGIEFTDLPVYPTYLLRRALPFTRSTYPPASVLLSNIQR